MGFMKYPFELAIEIKDDYITFIPPEVLARKDPLLSIWEVCICMEPKIRCSFGCLYIPKEFPKRSRPLECPRCGKINTMEQGNSVHKKAIPPFIRAKAEPSEDLFLSKEDAQENFNPEEDFEDLGKCFRTYRCVERDEDM